MNQKATIACTLYSNGNISVYFETNLTSCRMPLSVKINSNKSSLHSQTTSPVHYNNVNLSMKFIQANLLNDTRGSRTNRTVHNDMDYIIYSLY
ncbi:hypothetical protein KSF78_0000074 [Schistosoma japonicum]|nr:hypothetical protein KSF78_0000074 [Schistosoma japonicum]